jgi:hypothetical protein
VIGNINNGVKLSLPSSFQLIKATTTDASNVYMGSLFLTSSKISGMKCPQLPSSPQKQNTAKKKWQNESTHHQQPHTCHLPSFDEFVEF